MVNMVDMIGVEELGHRADMIGRMDMMNINLIRNTMGRPVDKQA